MRKANRTVRRPPQATALYVEPLEDRLTLSSIASTVISPEFAVANQQMGEIPAAVRIIAPTADSKIGQLDEPNTSANDTMPDDDYAEGSGLDSDATFVAQNLADGARVKSSGTVDDTPESTGQQAYLRTRDTATTSATPTETDPTAKQYEASEYAKTNAYEKYQTPNTSLAEQVVVTSVTSRQPSHLPSAMTLPVVVSSSPSAAATPPVVVTQAAGVSIAPRRPSSRELDFPEAPLADSLRVSPEDLSSVVVEQNATPVECFAIGELPATVSESSSLLAGAMPFDLTTLRQAANDLFARMESLGEGISAVTEELSLTRCLVVATIAAGGLEFVRRRGKRAEIDGVVQSDSGEGPSWAPLLVLVVLQPEGEP